jgi:uncharacterized protein YuzE
MAEMTIPDSLVADLIALAVGQIWVEYDREADVLYLSFRKPQQANDSIMEDADRIYHYHNDELVGVTVLHASQQAKS